MTDTGDTGDTGETRRILLTGAAGRIGGAFRDHAGDRYRFRLGDHLPIAPADAEPHEAIALDVGDLAACRAACAGMDTVVHLAADRHGDADFYGSLLNNNVKGAYNIFRAAKDAGCRRVVFASSVQAVSGYPADATVRPDDPVWPRNMYGASKCFGEATARVFAHTEGLSCICVRIGLWDSGFRREEMDANRRRMYVSQRDLNQLLVRCVETPDVPYAIVHGVSDNHPKRLDIASTRELLGYAPQDDGFRVFGG